MKTTKEGDCWAKHYGALEWIIYAPNLFCLVVNLLILVNILRILLCQMHCHPHEPSNFRKGLKAAFMLVPLFGLQMLLTLYRPKLGISWQREYEYFTYVVTNTQGIFVAIIFCYLNGEVISNFRHVCPCGTYGRGLSKHPHSMVTNTSHFTMHTEDQHTPPDTPPLRHNNCNHDSNKGFEMMKMQHLNHQMPTTGQDKPLIENKPPYNMVTTTTENGDRGKYQPIPPML